MDILRIDPVKYKKLGYDTSAVDECVKLMTSGMYEKALILCDESLKKNSNDPLILSQKGVAYIKLNRIEDARKCFDLGIDIDPKIGTLWYNKASLSALQNNESEALSFLEKAISLDSRCIQLAKNDEDFWILKNNDDFISIVGN